MFMNIHEHRRTFMHTNKHRQTYIHFRIKSAFLITNEECWRRSIFKIYKKKKTKTNITYKNL
ncbi:hypothetical protein HanRHA438_Chr11g0497391 [Helianthus annuus]|nr:hypothetical protein HanRHA438_Chr11g0497391 [Helianthus annuus]